MVACMAKRKTKTRTGSRSRRAKRTGSMGVLQKLSPRSGDAFPHDVSVARMVSYAVGIVFNVLIIVYLTQLESMRCACAGSSGWMPVFIKWSLIFSMVMIPFTLFLRTRLDVMARMWNSGALQALAAFAFVVGLVKAYAMLNYSLDLYRCKCADDWRRVLMLWEGGMAVFLYFVIFGILGYALVKSTIP